MDGIVQFISSVGFPILACIVMAYYVKYTSDKNSEQIKEINESHREEMSAITAALENNTRAIDKLTMKIGGE